MKGSPIFVPGLVLLFLATFLAAEPPKRMSLELRPHCMLYADKIEFTDPSMKTGTATGAVFMDLTTAQSDLRPVIAWAESVTFDLGQGTFTLRGWPRMIRQNHDFTALAKSTYFLITLTDASEGGDKFLTNKVNTQGLTRTDTMQLGDPAKYK